jgi:hypothetical protein
VQVYRNGVIEAAAGIANIAGGGRAVIAPEDMEDQITTKLENYLNVLRAIEVPPPLAVLLAGVRTQGMEILRRDPGYVVAPTPRTEPDTFFPPVIVDDYADLPAYRRALRPIFDALWNAAGYEGSPSYGPDGSWRRRS